MIRSGAEREAINMPIQGTAADVVKFAMLEMDRRLSTDTPGRLLMQVHDELVFEVARTQVPVLEATIREVLEGIYTKDGIILRVDVHFGDTWASAKG